MNKVSLKVESSTKTKNDNYCNKLVNKSMIEIETDFGKVAQERTSTYYLFTEKENSEGMEAELDLDLFDVIEKEFPFVDEAGESQLATLKYLYPKRA